MRQLLLGIIDFRRRIRPQFLSSFYQLGIKQSPNSLFIACSDSRVVPNLFASTNPGDLFVVRNVGNLIPQADLKGRTTADEAELAAIEFSINILKVQNIIVCGHSECGAMKALLTKAAAEASNDPKQQKQQKAVESSCPHLFSWLRHGVPSVDRYNKKLHDSVNPIPIHFQGRTVMSSSLDSKIPPHDQLSQQNVLQQLDHILTYPIVKERFERNELLLHGWWFDVANADVYSYSEAKKKFVLIDESKAEKLLRRLPGGEFQQAREQLYKQPAWMDPYVFKK